MVLHTMVAFRSVVISTDFIARISKILVYVPATCNVT